MTNGFDQGKNKIPIFDLIDLNEILFMTSVRDCRRAHGVCSREKYAHAGLAFANPARQCLHAHTLVGVAPCSAKGSARWLMSFCARRAAPSQKCLQARTRELTEALRWLERLGQARNEHLLRIGHDLHSPMGSNRAILPHSNAGSTGRMTHKSALQEHLCGYFSHND
jgi:hypothetical protein